MAEMSVPVRAWDRVLVRMIATAALLLLLWGQGSASWAQTGPIQRPAADEESESPSLSGLEALGAPFRNLFDLLARPMSDAEEREFQDGVYEGMRLAGTDPDEVMRLLRILAAALAATGPQVAILPDPTPRREDAAANDTVWRVLRAWFRAAARYLQERRGELPRELLRILALLNGNLESPVVAGELQNALLTFARGERPRARQRNPLPPYLREDEDRPEDSESPPSGHNGG